MYLVISENLSNPGGPTHTLFHLKENALKEIKWHKTETIRCLGVDYPDAERREELEYGGDLVDALDHYYLTDEIRATMMLIIPADTP
jgi:hypothetical protein